VLQSKDCIIIIKGPTSKGREGRRRGGRGRGRVGKGRKGGEGGEEKGRE